VTHVWLGMKTFSTPAFSIRHPVLRDAHRTYLTVTLALTLPLASARGASANEVLDWNTTAATLFNLSQNPLEQSRSFAMVQIAVHDALNAIEPRYSAYAYHAEAPAVSPEAAVASAAHDVLLALLPGSAPDLGVAYAAALGDVAEGEGKTRGIALGRAAAARVLELRSADDVAGALERAYVPGPEPGDYQITPPFDFVLGAGWGDLEPFAVPVASAFRPRPPAELTSRRYTVDFAEVKRVGERESPTRTAEQSEIATFWYESSATGWQRIANAVARAHGLDLWESARVLGLVSLAQADGFINGFNAKYYYEYWRPITAIRAADTDGNPRTQIDPEWTPFCDTPPVADYPSTHSVLGAAAAEVLARYFGDATPFGTDSLSLAGVVRTFPGFRAAARENADSRVYCGIHWRHSTDAGVLQGQQIGRYTFEHYFVPECH